MGTINTFKCNSSKCNGAYTRHVGISLSEAAAIDAPINNDDSTGEKVGKGFARGIVGVFDLFGGKYAVKAIGGISPYKCCNCGRCSWRANDGEDKGYIGYSK